MTVKEYIAKNWDNTIHAPEDVDRGIVKMPKPFSVPCAKGIFSDFYYWDTYFANIGFMLDGKADQAENNLDIMDYFIRNLGYMPNANHLTDRSQPPLFVRGIYDLYQHTKNKKIIEKYIGAIFAEYDFFANDRMTKIGLNQYRTNSPRSILKSQYPWLAGRIGESRDTLDKQIELTYDLLSIAESGWDFNPRFKTPENRFATREFVHLDLNSILYDAERKIAELLREIDAADKAVYYDNKADERKALMDKYMKASDGVYYDYNFEKGEHSKTLSCASLYVYAMGISDDKAAAKKVLERLELPYGLSACEYRGEEEEYLQWDYPSMWPSNVYFAYVGLKKLGLDEDAKRIAKKYLKTVEDVFEKTGSLWEKYNAKEGAVSVTREYETPEMMGWTAGVYRFLQEELNK